MSPLESDTPTSQFRGVSDQEEKDKDLSSVPQSFSYTPL
jgi:hypothetical protein